MKQLTQSEIRKNGKVYKNVSSPATEGTMKQVTDIVEKDGTFSISTDGGKTYSPASGAVPEALPQEASALKSGNLPTSGWTDGDYVTYWTGSVYASGWYYYKKLFQDNNIYSDVVNGVKFVATVGNKAARLLYNHGIKQIGQGTTSHPLITGYVLSFDSTYKRDNEKIIITEDGNVYGTGSYSAGSDNGAWWEMVGKYELKQKLYTISDTSITSNSDILMELTDEGGVKAYSMEAGKMTVIRDTVPTQPILYTYKVKQTNASGQFTLVNHFVPSVPESPTSLPVTYKKVSGKLPTTGWGDIAAPLLVSGELTYSGDQWINSVGNIGEEKAALKTGWKVTVTGAINNTYIQGSPAVGQQSITVDTYTGYKNLSLYDGVTTDFNIRLYDDGVVNINSKHAGDYNITIYNTNDVSKTYTITDTAITANTSVKMYLTDAGGVKAQSKANGSITVLRGMVPTTVIPYEYEVKQTSTSGLFEVINAYVPDIPTKTSELTNDSGFLTTADIPTKTSQLTNDSGFITNSAIGKGTLTIQKNGANVATFGANQSENATANISVPTKTSDLTNDSGFVTSADVPTKTSQLENDSGFATTADIPTKTSQLQNDSGFVSVGEWKEWTSTSALTEEGLYEIVAEGGINLRYTFFIQYEQGLYNYGACWVSATSTDVSVIAPQCSADGKLSVKKSLSSGGTTEPLAFKYRKIN